MLNYNYPSLPVERAQLPLAHVAELGAETRDANFLPKATWLVISGKAGARSHMTRLQRPHLTP